ncbi:MAG: SCO family protein [Acidobacteriota bacterium]|nr:SCO family protein [Acidobacteriota bacterium]
MNTKIAHCLFVIVSVFAVSVFSGCKSEPARSPNEKHYELKGKVVSVEKDKHLVTIAHEDIKDYMPAMTMPFSVKDNWVLEVVKPGDHVTATYVVDGTQSWLEDVVIAQEGTDTTNPVTGSGAEPKPGDEIPNYRLINQDGKTIRIHDYKGKPLLLTFIFTRCQDPDQCTLMSSNFATINQELQKQPELYGKTHLLSISFDPEYDTPKVLRSYGAAFTGKYADETFETWEFASGTADEVKGIAQFFGLRYYRDEQTGKEQMIHSLRTALIGPDSKVVKIYRGNDWKPEEVLKETQNLYKPKAQVTQLRAGASPPS